MKKTSLTRTTQPNTALKTILTLLAIITLAPQNAGARETLPLNDGWRFSFRHEGSSDRARAVTLPHTWNLDALAGAADYLRTEGDYERTLDVPRSWTGRRVFVRFGGAQTVATVFVNGRWAGEHLGGGAAFAFEITDLVDFGAPNQLRVTVSNAPVAVFPLSAAHNVYGGLNRTAELLVTDPTAVSPLHLGTSGVLLHQRSVSSDRAEVEAEIHLTARREEAVRLTLTVRDPDGQRVVERVARVKAANGPVRLSFEIERPWLWSPARPSLYRVEVAVEGAASRDEVSLTTGFRSIEVTPQRGFLLNDTPLRIQGVTMYYDRLGVGDALTAEDIREDFAFVEELGANALRSPAGPHAPLLYDLCDARGVAAWVCLPLVRAPFLSDVAWYPSPILEERGRRQLEELIAQNLHHPSIVAWGIFDRLWMRGDDPVPYIKNLNDLSHRLDPSRPTAGCSDQDGPINLITDLIVWAQEVGWSRGRTADLQVWLGALGERWSHLRSGIEYGAPSAGGEHRQYEFHRDYAAILQRDTLLWGRWVRTLFDYGSARTPGGVETTGLVSIDRRRRKEAFYLYKELWRAAPAGSEAPIDSLSTAPAAGPSANNRSTTDSPATNGNLSANAWM